MVILLLEEEGKYTVPHQRHVIKASRTSNLNYAKTKLSTHRCTQLKRNKENLGIKYINFGLVNK